MFTTNIPIETISYCNTQGQLNPLRIRLEDEEHMRRIFPIDQVLYRKEQKYAGISTLLFGCQVVIGKEARLLELKYNIMSHTWTLSKIIS